MRTTNRNQVKQFFRFKKILSQIFSTLTQVAVFKMYYPVLPHSKQCMKTQIKMYLYKEKVCMSRAIHVHGSLVTALGCVVLALLIHSHSKSQEGHPLSTLTPP